jgi:hypothetical protein
LCDGCVLLFAQATHRGLTMRRERVARVCMGIIERLESDAYIAHATRQEGVVYGYAGKQRDVL